MARHFKTMGAFLQNITDLLANATSATEQQIFENWKAILSQLQLVESVEQGASNVDHVNIAMTMRDLANGGRTGAHFAMLALTRQIALLLCWLLWCCFRCFIKAVVAYAHFAFALRIIKG